MGNSSFGVISICNESSKACAVIALHFRLPFVAPTSYCEPPTTGVYSLGVNVKGMAVAAECKLPKKRQSMLQVSFDAPKSKQSN